MNAKLDLLATWLLLLSVVLLPGSTMETWVNRGNTKDCTLPIKEQIDHQCIYSVLG